MKNNYGVLILAAGLSERMGVPKFLLGYDNSVTFYEKIIDGYLKSGISHMVMVINRDDFKHLNRYKNKIEVVVNDYPGRGRFYSFVTGLKAFGGIKNIFVHNVDNPFVIEPVLNKMISDLKTRHYVVPVYQGKGGHPVLLSSQIVADAVSLYDYNNNIKEYLKKFGRINRVTCRAEVTVNINTPGDYEKFLKGLKSGFYK